MSEDDPARDPWLTVRASGFRAVLAAVVLVLGTVLTCLAAAYRLPFPAIVGLTMMFVAYRGWQIAVSGRADIWPDGIDNRSAGHPASITVDDVESIRVVVTLLGRSVQVVDRDGSYFTLAGPRRSVLFAGRDFDLEVERLRRYLVASRYPALITRTRTMMSVSQVVLLVLLGAPVLLASFVSLWRAVV